MHSTYSGLRPFTCAIVAGSAIALLAQGCGSSTSSSPGVDGGVDTGTTTHHDAGKPVDSGKKPDSAKSEDSGKHVDAGEHDASKGTPDTGASDTGLVDSASHDTGAAKDSGTKADSGTDSGAAAGTCTGVNGSACEVNSSNGLCEGHICSSCNDPTDDATCKAAYPPAALCLAGVCAPGDCRADTDCTTGEICGADKPNFCGKCKSDGACQADATYGAADICDLATGACVTGVCTMNDKKCPSNATDFCCALKCVPGNCCVTSDCTGSNETCQNNQCTKCALATNNTYYVDPKNGDDGTATGSGATGGGCAFQTITRALQFIGPTPVAGTKIEVLSTAAVVAPPEVMPVVVPKNVTIEGATAGAPSTVDVPTDETGFTLAADASGLSNLILDGTGLAGSTGIVATTGSGATTTLTNVTVKNMGLDGIDVSHTGKLSIGTGVSSSTNGVGAAHSGLVVQDNGICTITVNTGGTAATFSHNTQFGISVLGAGSITIGGTLNPAAVASSNSDAGLYIVQTPGNGVPANTVSNFASNTSLKGNGIHVYGGSSLKLRNSVTQGNPADGIEIQTYVNGTTTSDDVTHIDLGTAADAGGNTFQYATGAMPNANTGICLDLTATAGQTLNAAGNIFEAANCATAADTLTHTANACSGATDYGIIGATTTNKITLTKCM